MIQLFLIDYLSISHWFPEFQKKSKSNELPPEEGECVGIYKDKELIGYFILRDLGDNVLEINQGFLKRQFRHLNLSKECMRVLEDKAREVGFKRIVLASSRANKSYRYFMHNLGYEIDRVVYFKEV